MQAYEFEDYKDALKALLNGRKAQFGSRFTFEKMAIACGVQKTYLSKVINGSGQLSADQLYAASEFLELPVAETDYLQQVRDLQLAQNPSRQALLKKRLDDLRSKRLKTEALIEVENEQNVQNRLWEYYSDIDLQLVHLFLTVPHYATDADQICDKIGISEDRLKAILLKLQNWKIIEFAKNKYVANDPKMHLPEDSPAFLAFGILTRIKTLEKLRRRDAQHSADYFFSVFFSAETAFQDRLKKMLLQLLKETQAEVVEAKAQQVYQLNIDFFRWT